MGKAKTVRTAPKSPAELLPTDDSADPVQIDGMMAEERRTQILKILRANGRVKVDELKRRFRTSAVTIRNDLNELDQKGLVQRSHGGAVVWIRFCASHRSMSV